MSAPERIWASRGKLGGIWVNPDTLKNSVAFIRDDIHRAELAQVHDLYASLARNGASTTLIRETAERAAVALREARHD